MANDPCPQCGKRFEPSPAQRKYYREYCSSVCYELSRTTGVQRQCPVCGREFYARPWRVKRGWSVYCSRNCLSQGRLQGEIRPCAACGKPIYRSAGDAQNSRSGLFFCNNSCRASRNNRQRAGENHPNWKGGHSVYRDTMLRSDRAQVCERCGLTDERLLTVHHLDEDRSNNHLDKLSWLCPNCHYLIHHYEDEREGFMGRRAEKHDPSAVAHSSTDQ